MRATPARSTSSGTRPSGGTGTIAFVGPGGTVKTQANVTLGPGITVHGTSGSLDIISGSLTNQGTIDSDGGGTLAIAGNPGTSWTNASGGILQAEGGTLALGGPWSNAGQIVVNNSTLNLGNFADAWSDQGTITATSRTVNLGGSFTLVALGIFPRSGGTVNLTGTLDNTGTTLVLDATTGSWNLATGTLKGGTLATLDGTALTSTVEPRDARRRDPGRDGRRPSPAGHGGLPSPGP